MKNSKPGPVDILYLYMQYHSVYFVSISSQDLFTVYILMVSFSTFLCIFQAWICLHIYDAFLYIFVPILSQGLLTYMWEQFTFCTFLCLSQARICLQTYGTIDSVHFCVYPKPGFVYKLMVPLILYIFVSIPSQDLDF